MIEVPPPNIKAPVRNLTPQLLHDLRTPLNHIIGYSEMLLGQVQEEGQTSLVPDLKRIQGAGQQLLALLDNRLSGPKGDLTSDEGLPQVNALASRKSVTADGDPTGQLDSEGSQPLILVVDDNKENRDLLARRLQQQNYGVEMAENGLEALARLRSQSFDLVLLDIMMPEIDGYEVLQQLKADESLRHIPVIMVSAVDELSSVVRCIEMGAQDYLLKPCEPTLLKARVGACLDKKRAHDRETRLFAQLEQNFKRLQELEQLRDSLTHMIIHDLRTPLSSLISGMQAVLGMGELNGDQHEAVRIALSGGETLLSMINGLLDIDKMESGLMQLDYSLLDAAMLVSRALDQVTQLAADRGQTLGTNIPEDLPAFEGDDHTLRRTLVNLIGNAIKFTPDGGTVTVAVSQSKDGESLVFSVHDTGEGIPAESFKRIFEKFGQVNSRKGGRTMSTGLGLTFCRLAVEAHGGKIGVESVPGEGSDFTFTIPLVQGG